MKLLFAFAVIAVVSFDIISTTVTTIKGASSMVVSIITPTISFPLGMFTHLSTFADGAVCGINIGSTAITTIEITIGVVVHVITEVITNPAINTVTSSGSIVASGGGCLSGSGWLWFKTFTNLTPLGVDLSAAVTTIKGTSSIVIVIIAEVVSLPGRNGTSILRWHSGCLWWRLKTSTNTAVSGVNIVTTAVSSIIFTSSIVVFIITEVVSLP